MLLVLLAYFGGVLTIVSPCILPVLPFVFAKAEEPFVRSGLPLLLSMAATFAVVATLAAVVGGWAVALNQYGRIVALVLLAAFGVVLLFPSLSDRLTRPLVALGSRLSQSGESGSGHGSIVSSLLLGVATGLLWAPCAGPVLGLILTGAALHGANAGTTFLLVAYAAGAATSLALALLVGGKVFTAMKKSFGVAEWIKRGIGVAVLAAVAAIALGLDTGLLTRLSLSNTASLEQRLLDKFNPQPNAQPRLPDAMAGGPATGALPLEGTFPSLAGANTWLNSPPLSAEALKGKVVLVDFWTYSCINCVRSIPYVRGWAEKYKDQGLVVIGVHAPEFAFEKNVDNVRKAVADFKIGYPVAIDNDFAIWRAFGNQYWPAHYFIDANGQIRHHHFGEGDYEASERVIQQLLTEAGKPGVSTDLVAVNASGAEAAPAKQDVLSPETYVGYGRAKNFTSAGGMVRDGRQTYVARTPQINEWGLTGSWTVGAEHAVLNEKGGGIVYKFHARDLHLVLGPGSKGKPVRFKVTIDGAAPGESHGADTDAQGLGSVAGQRLYQLIRQKGVISDRLFEIQFLDPDVQAYAFTFG
ncbi:MAG: cytochrome c biogenesis protein DipZ [Betaproteobacteria bacterium]